MQREARRYYPVEMNGNVGYGTYTDIRPRVSYETDQWKLRYRRKDQPGVRIQEKVRSLGGTRHDDRELFKWNSQNEPAAFASTEIRVLGERPRSHTLYMRLFYVARQFVPALYLPDNLTPIYGFVRVKSRPSRK